MDNDFSNVKVGDRLWSTVAGWTMVTEINSVAVIVITRDDGKEFFFHNGRSYEHPAYPQSLFFEEMEMVPIKPVRKIEEPKSFDPNKPYQRRDEKSCKIVHTTKEGKFVVIVAETDLVYYCRQNGHYLISSEHNNDLINIPEKVEGWVNIYKGGITSSFAHVYDTKKEADKQSSSNRFACHYFSVKEGEGLKCQD